MNADTKLKVKSGGEKGSVKVLRKTERVIATTVFILDPVETIGELQGNLAIHPAIDSKQEVPA
jgi:hypothetical protein